MRVRSGAPAARRGASAARLLLGGALALLAWPAAGAVAASPAATPEAAPAQAGERRPLLGLSLTEALLELNARGLKIVFTSEVVGPELRVWAEPAAADPRALLDELLAPHGLAAVEGGGGTLVVVAAPPPADGRSIGGTVLSRETLRAVVGATVRVVEAGVEVASGADGRFRIEGLEPGVYTLESRLRNFLTEEVEGIAVGLGGPPPEVAFTLRPVPFVYDEIVVRPSRLSLLDDEPAAPLSLSRKEIGALPHLGGDVFRALSLLPGVAGNDVSAQFHVHGGRRDEVQILLDGQELYEAFHLQDFDSALSVVAAQELGSVSLTTGGFPATYGDRMSGVLEMTTETPAEPPRTRLSLSLLTAVAASGGSFGGGRGGWLASGRRGSIDLANRVIGKEDPSFWDLFGKVESDLGRGHYLRGNLLVAGDALDFQEEVDGESKRFETDYDSAYMWLTHRTSFGDRLLVETAVSRSRIDRDRQGAEDEEEQSFEVVDRREFDVVGVANRWSWQVAPGYLAKWGVEARRYTSRYDYANEVEADFVLAAPGTEPRTGLTSFADRFRGEHLGAYVADRFSLGEPLTVELGLRYDRHPLTADTLFSPRANLAWRLGERGVVRAAWGHFHQSQRPYELAVEDGESRFARAEQSEHWVIGYERLLGRRQRAPLPALRVEVYQRLIREPRPRYENLLEPINVFPEIERDRVRLSPERSRAEGIEILVRGSAGARTDWWVNYAYATAEDRIAGRQVPRKIDQTHTVNFDVNTRLGRRWNLNAAWRYHTGWPTTPVSLAFVPGEDGEPVPTPVAGDLNSRRLSSYHRMDVRVSREWRLRSSLLVFFVDVQNLYNRKNLAGFDLILDDELGELTARGETWAGLFPSVGISWSF